MKTMENECVGCTSVGLRCLGVSCKYRNVVRLYCDLCESEVDTLYVFGYQELCEECVIKSLEKIEKD